MSLTKRTNSKYSFGHRRDRAGASALKNVTSTPRIVGPGGY